MFELILVIPFLRLPNRIVFWNRSVSVIIANSGLLNASVCLAKMFWELFSVTSVEEPENQNFFEIHLVIFLCVMVMTVTGMVMC